MQTKKKYLALAGLTATFLSIGMVGPTMFDKVLAATSTTQSSVTSGGKWSMNQRLMMDEKVQRTVTNIDNGIKVTMTSTDATTVTKLQSGEKIGRKFGGQGRNHGRGGFGAGMMDENVQRTVTNINNGIKVTMTSTDAATVTKLKAHKVPEAPADSNKKFKVTQTELTNGIQLTITSTDPATVTKLQSGEKMGRKFGGPGRGHHGNSKNTSKAAATATTQQ